MVDITEKVNVNGKVVEVTSNPETGIGSVKYDGKTIGTITIGGNVNFNGGDQSAQKKLLGLSGGRSRFLGRDLQDKVRGPVEGQNIQTLNKNGTKSQLTNLSNEGYGNKLKIPGTTTGINDNNENTKSSAVGGSGGGDTGETFSQTTPTSKKDFQDGDGARYPLDHIGREYDIVRFTIIEYTPAGKSGMKNLVRAGGGGRPTDRIKRSSPKASFIMPMPSNIADANNAGWGPNKLNAFQAAGTDLVTNMLGDEAGAVSKSLDNSMAGLGENKTQLKDFVKGKVAEKITGGSDIITRTTGAVMNSNLELLFSGPNLRQFGFQYRLTPRSAEEAGEIKKIVRMTKKAMSAKLKGDGSLFLYTPDIFFIDFLHNGKPHPFLNRIKPCALTGFNMVYTGDGAYMTYENGSPVAYQMTMSFTEIEPIYDIDYDQGDGAEGMGF